jgi:hypothetical protein
MCINTHYQRMMNCTQEKNTTSKNNEQNRETDNTKSSNTYLENQKVMKEQIVEFYKSRQNKKFEKLENTFAYK